VTQSADSDRVNRTSDASGQFIRPLYWPIVRLHTVASSLDIVDRAPGSFLNVKFKGIDTAVLRAEVTCLKMFNYNRPLIVIPLIILWFPVSFLTDILDILLRFCFHISLLILG
jgi:hypothetical protein